MRKLVVFIIILFIALPVLANNIVDTDNDGLSDELEVNLYKTDPQKVDTDGDGYNDGDEVKNNYSPLNPKKVKMKDNDYDHDGLSDGMEIKFKTDLTNPDTDGDGYNDGDEVKNNYSPLNPKKVKMKDNDYDHDGLSDGMEIKFKTDLTNSDTDGDGYKDGDEINKGYDPLNKTFGVKLAKKIEVNLKQQTLSYFLSNVKLGEFLVSSGKNNTTPKGNFKISNKSIKAWSPYGLWMPYWLGIEGQKFGIHELPIWPNGYREGQDHLGKPVSHGCIRLGVGPAKIIYNWIEKGTKISIN